MVEPLVVLQAVAAAVLRERMVRVKMAAAVVVPLRAAAVVVVETETVRLARLE